MSDRIQVVDKLINRHTLSAGEWACLLENVTPELMDYIKKNARETTDRIFGRQVYVRGLIEFTNICRKDCYCCVQRMSEYRLPITELPWPI